jgi:hypothetical protein
MPGIIELADRMAATPSNISDDLSSLLRAQFSEEQLMELSAQIAFENFRTRLNRVFAVGSDDLYEPAIAGPIPISSQKQDHSLARTRRRASAPPPGFC